MRRSVSLRISMLLQQTCVGLKVNLEDSGGASRCSCVTNFLGVTISIRRSAGFVKLKRIMQMRAAWM